MSLLLELERVGEGAQVAALARRETVGDGARRRHDQTGGQQGVDGALDRVFVDAEALGDRGRRPEGVGRAVQQGQDVRVGHVAGRPASCGPRRGGAKGGTRTPTAVNHWLLKPARLPVPPLSQLAGPRFSAAAGGMSIASVKFLIYSDVAKKRETPPMVLTSNAAPAVLERPKAVPPPRENVSNEIWNLPNSLTLFRIFLVPLLVVVLLTKYSNRLGLAIFLVAAVTDFFDGYFARRMQKR